LSTVHSLYQVGLHGKSNVPLTGHAELGSLETKRLPYYLSAPRPLIYLINGSRSLVSVVYKFQLSHVRALARRLVPSIHSLRAYS
jgi:hypothetical protein